MSRYWNEIWPKNPHRALCVYCFEIPDKTVLGRSRPGGFEIAKKKYWSKRKIAWWVAPRAYAQNCNGLASCTYRINDSIDSDHEFGFQNSEVWECPFAGLSIVMSYLHVFVKALFGRHVYACTIAQTAWPKMSCSRKVLGFILFGVAMSREVHRSTCRMYGVRTPRGCSKNIRLGIRVISHFVRETTVMLLFQRFSRLGASVLISGLLVPTSAGSSTQ